MTSTKQKSKPGGKPNNDPPPYARETYVNNLGIPQVVLLPEGETDVEMGIPLSLDLTPLFGHMPEAFQREFYKALHAQGLIEPADFFKSGAADRYRRALLTVIKHDFLSIQAIAKQEL
jgi:hypothetical protein